MDKRSRKKPKIPSKFRLLFDSAFAKPSVFVKLSKKANLAHIRHTYNLSPGAEDEHIYQVATDTKRIIITQDEGFKKRVKPKGPGIFIVPPHISNDKMDLLLTEFISGKDPADFIGKATKI